MNSQDHTYGSYLCKRCGKRVINGTLCICPKLPEAEPDVDLSKVSATIETDDHPLVYFNVADYVAGLRAENAALKERLLGLDELALHLGAANKRIAALEAKNAVRPRRCKEHMEADDKLCIAEKRIAELEALIALTTKFHENWLAAQKGEGNDDIHGAGTA